MIIEESIAGRSLLARLDHGAEMIGQIADLARERRIKAAAISAIGALTRADLGFYDQAGREYMVRAVEGPVEIASCTGNISLSEGVLLCTPMPYWRTAPAGSWPGIWSGEPSSPPSCT